MARRGGPRSARPPGLHGPDFVRSPESRFRRCGTTRTFERTKCNRWFFRRHIMPPLRRANMLFLFVPPQHTPDSRVDLRVKQGTMRARTWRGPVVQFIAGDGTRRGGARHAEVAKGVAPTKGPRHAKEEYPSVVAGEGEEAHGGVEQKVGVATRPPSPTPRSQHGLGPGDGCACRAARSATHKLSGEDSEDE